MIKAQLCTQLCQKHDCSSNDNKIIYLLSHFTGLQCRALCMPYINFKFYNVIHILILEWTS